MSQLQIKDYPKEQMYRLRGFIDEKEIDRKRYYKTTPKEEVLKDLEAVKNKMIEKNGNVPREKKFNIQDQQGKEYRIIWYVDKKRFEKCVRYGKRTTKEEALKKIEEIQQKLLKGEIF